MFDRFDEQLRARQESQEAAVNQLRDHFAGLAMNAYLMAEKCDRWDTQTVAERAYAMADRMLEAREKNNG